MERVPQTYAAGVRFRFYLDYLELLGFTGVDIFPFILRQPGKLTDEFIFSREGKPPQANMVDAVAGVGRCALAAGQVVKGQQANQGEHDEP